MSSSAAASAYWRVAGMSYLKYSGLCADMVRAALKEPARTKARTREVVFFRRAEWKDGQPQKQSESTFSLIQPAVPIWQNCRGHLVTGLISYLLLNVPQL